MILLLVAAAASLRPERPSLGQLVATDPDAFLDITFVFRPLDCKLAPGLIHELNALATQPHFAVRGVMVQPPIGHGEAETVLQEFAIEFPVTIDWHGQWMKALAEERQVNPVFILSQKGERLAVVSPTGVGAMQRYLSQLGVDP